MELDRCFPGFFHCCSKCFNLIDKIFEIAKQLKIFFLSLLSVEFFRRYHVELALFTKESLVWKSVSTLNIHGFHIYIIVWNQQIFDVDTVQHTHTQTFLTILCFHFLWANQGWTQIQNYWNLFQYDFHQKKFSSKL